MLHHFCFYISKSGAFWVKYLWSVYREITVSLHLVFSDKIVAGPDSFCHHCISRNIITEMNITLNNFNSLSINEHRSNSGGVYIKA